MSQYTLNFNYANKKKTLFIIIFVILLCLIFGLVSITEKLHLSSTFLGIGITLLFLTYGFILIRVINKKTEISIFESSIEWSNDFEIRKLLYDDIEYYTLHNFQQQAIELKLKSGEKIIFSPTIFKKNKQFEDFLKELTSKLEHSNSNNNSTIKRKTPFIEKKPYAIGFLVLNIVAFILAFYTKDKGYQRFILPTSLFFISIPNFTRAFFGEWLAKQEEKEKQQKGQ